MMAGLLALVLVQLCAPAQTKPEAAAPEEVTFTSGKLELHGFLWKPEGAGPPDYFRIADRCDRADRSSRFWTGRIDLEVWTEVSFAGHEGKTKLTVHQKFSFESDETRRAPIGWSQTLDNLAEYVAKL